VGLKPTRKPGSGMSSEVALALAGLCLTYLLRSAAAYLLLRLLCWLVPDPHLRFRLCGIFLGGMVAGWLGLLLLPGFSALSRPHTAPLAGVSGPHWSWTLNSALVPRLATILSGAPWVYVALFCFLMLHFFSRFWRLRVLLRSSQRPSEALSFLFESVRCDTGAPRCELRLVQGIRSPAATAWWDPKILLPSELLPRLETLQLVDIFRHELMHVRRRDYLWDRLASLGCYVVFFHPAGWLVRRSLRWERELVCDEGVVERSSERRLEYATCLTTLANWRFSGEEFAGPVDFLSSSSLLTTRVRALVSPSRGKYSPQKRAAMGLLAAISLTLVVWLVPDVAVTPSWSAPAPAQHNAPRTQEPPPRPQTVLKAERHRVSKRNKFQVPGAVAPDVYSRFAPPNREFPVSTPVLSRASDLQTRPISAGGRVRWGLIPKVGGWAMRSVRFGVSKMGSHIAGHKREKPPSGQLPSAATEMPIDPV
jgi:beta-lactamase regulating signal transducer with metallopeptidase domain